MREPGAILLISCYELGHQPLSLASPLAVLKRAGYEPLGLDTSVETLSNDVIRCARFVGISVPMHTAMRLGVHVAERVRAINPDAHICFYGLYATLNADYLLQRYADSVISGEYEQPLLAVCRRKHFQWSRMPHIGSRDPSSPQYMDSLGPLTRFSDKLLELVQERERGESTSIEPAGDQDGTGEPYIAKIPFTVPDRTSLPSLERYARFRSNGALALAGYTETSRGCLHTCRHCPITPIYNGRFFVIPREIVLEDIRQQVVMGARHITFGDPDFFNGPGHAVAIARQMHREFPHLTFDVTTKIEHILEFRRYMPELKELGCAFIVSAVESLSDLVLEKLKKDHTQADVVEALDILNEAGIPLRPSFVAFTPWTTIHDYLEVLDFIEAHGLIRHVDPVQYSIRLLIPPDSAILDLPDTEEWLGPLDAASYTYQWDHPEPRMDDLYQQVSELVEEAARTNTDILTTFYATKALAASMAGVPAQIPTPEERPAMPMVPGLTEAWFC